MLSRVMENTSCCNLNMGNILREVTVKIELERIDTQEGVIVEAFLDSRATRLVMSLEFARKQGFKLKKIERPIYVRNRPATKLVMLKVCNVKLSFDIWLVLYIYFILYS